MAAAVEPMEPILLSLPGYLLNDIGSWLNDQELCNMELANKELHLIMSNPSRPGPCERRLYLGAHLPTGSPKASRSPTIYSFCEIPAHMYAAMLKFPQPIRT